ncbi:CAP domain-containing protein [Microbispora sp. NPDC049125]|uniref:CAP domain-containing protein n=1 Tax=Microbispora sp. NPDC049125 TaxID=3154929 RepID=UPI003465FA32
MNRVLGAALCLGSVAAIGVSAGPAQAESGHTGCRVATTKPYVAQDGKIHAAGSRAGCVDTALFRVRVLKSRTGPDRVVKSGSKVVRNARVTVSVRCAAGVFYTAITDYRGHTSKSKPVRLTCAPAPSTVGTALENEVVQLTNAERAKAGCGPLKHDARLHAAAYGHSADMSARNTLDHDSADGRTFDQRIKAAGYSFTAAAENIMKDLSKPSDVVQGWMNSAGHRQNILNCAYTDIGVGYVAAGGSYWTQDFGKH